MCWEKAHDFYIPNGLWACKSHEPPSCDGSTVFIPAKVQMSFELYQKKAAALNILPHRKKRKSLVHHNEAFKDSEGKDVGMDNTVAIPVLEHQGKRLFRHCCFKMLWLSCARSANMAVSSNVQHET